MKEIFKKLFKRTLHIVFPFVKLENNDLIKEIKHILRAFISW